MTAFLLMGLMMGVVGSFHCVGMCGPLALSLPLGDGRISTKLSGALIYNTGRVVTYAFFGLVFGLIGTGIVWTGYQQLLSIIAGVLIIILLVLPRKMVASAGQTVFITRFLIQVRSALGRLFLKKNRGSLFVIGLLNGFLPCGLVYLAVAGAIASGSVVNSVLFMSAFGLGTLPMMWGVAFFGNYVGISFRRSMRRVYPYLMAGMACLLILRGMGLGIPYISPVMSPGKKVIQECCTKPD